MPPKNNQGNGKLDLFFKAVPSGAQSTPAVKKDDGRAVVDLDGEDGNEMDIEHADKFLSADRGKSALPGPSRLKEEIPEPSSSRRQSDYSGGQAIRDANGMLSPIWRYCYRLSADVELQEETVLSARMPDGNLAAWCGGCVDLAVKKESNVYDALLKVERFPARMKVLYHHLESSSCMSPAEKQDAMANMRQSKRLFSNDDIPRILKLLRAVPSEDLRDILQCYDFRAVKSDHDKGWRGLIDVVHSLRLKSTAASADGREMTPQEAISSLIDFVRSSATASSVVAAAEDDLNDQVANLSPPASKKIDLATEQDQRNFVAALRGLSSIEHIRSFVSCVTWQKKTKDKDTGKNIILPCAKSIATALDIKEARSMSASDGYTAIARVLYRANPTHRPSPEEVLPTLLSLTGQTRRERLKENEVRASGQTVKSVVQPIYRASAAAASSVGSSSIATVAGRTGGVVIDTQAKQDEVAKGVAAVAGRTSVGVAWYESDSTTTDPAGTAPIAGRTGGGMVGSRDQQDGDAKGAGAVAGRTGSGVAREESDSGTADQAAKVAVAGKTGGDVVEKHEKQGAADGNRAVATAGRTGGSERQAEEAVSRLIQRLPHRNHSSAFRMIAYRVVTTIIEEGLTASIADLAFVLDALTMDEDTLEFGADIQAGIAQMENPLQELPGKMEQLCGPIGKSVAVAYGMLIFSNDRNAALHSVLEEAQIRLRPSTRELIGDVRSCQGKILSGTESHSHANKNKMQPIFSYGGTTSKSLDDRASSRLQTRTTGGKVGPALRGLGVSGAKSVMKELFDPTAPCIRQWITGRKDISSCLLTMPMFRNPGQGALERFDRRNGVGEVAAISLLNTSRSQGGLIALNFLPGGDPIAWDVGDEMRTMIKKLDIKLGISRCPVVLSAPPFTIKIIHPEKAHFGKQIELFDLAISSLLSESQIPDEFQPVEGPPIVDVDEEGEEKDAFFYDPFTELQMTDAAKRICIACEKRSGNSESAKPKVIFVASKRVFFSLHQHRLDRNSTAHKEKLYQERKGKAFIASFDGSVLTKVVVVLGTEPIRGTRCSQQQIAGMSHASTNLLAYSLAAFFDDKPGTHEEVLKQFNRDQAGLVNAAREAIKHLDSSVYDDLARNRFERLTEFPHACILGPSTTTILAATGASADLPLSLRMQHKKAFTGKLHVDLHRHPVENDAIWARIREIEAGAQDDQAEYGKFLRVGDVVRAPSGVVRLWKEDTVGMENLGQILRRHPTVEEQLRNFEDS